MIAENKPTNSAPSSKPRILFLTKVYPFPPAVAGDAVYSRGIIEAISKTCDVTVVCAESGAEQRDIPQIEWHIVGQRKQGQLGSVLSKFPLIVWKGKTNEFSNKLEALLSRSWDAIVLDNIGLAHALQRVERYREVNKCTRLIYISHEFEYPTRSAKYGAYKLSLPKKMAAAWDLRKIRKWEEQLLKSCDIVTVINRDDLVPFRKIASQKKYFPLLPGYDGPVSSGRNVTVDTPRRVLLLGGRRSEQKKRILLDWLDVAYERMCAANIEMVVVGDMDNDLVKKIASKFPKTTVYGFVDDLEALINTARMGLIADTVGGGFKLRLLSHVFQRLPMVGLNEAIAGLPTNEGRGFLGADNLDVLSDLVCQKIDNVELINSLQETAFNDCENEFSWQTRAEDFTFLFESDSRKILV